MLRPVSGRYADIAQQVVRRPDKAEGAGSTPAFGTMIAISAIIVFIEIM